MVDIGEKAREEFFSEAQEIIDTLSRNLLAIDDALRAADGPLNPDLVNEAFRAVHTLKGLAGLFGATLMSTVSHRLEDVLDSIRLGRLDLTPEALDVLFRAVDVYGALLAAEKGAGDMPQGIVEELVEALEHIGEGPEAAPRGVADYELDAGLLSVLTEYEEHRLKTNIAEGLRLFRIRVKFDLATIDKALEDIKDRAKQFGEIITYLPTGEAASPDVIELDLLMASSADLDLLREALQGDNTVVEEIARKGRPAAPPQPAATTDPPEDPGPDISMASVDPTPAPAAPATAPDDGADGGALIKAVSQTVRVDIRKLDHLMNIVGELAIVRGMLARVADRQRVDGDRQLGGELMRLHRNFDRRLGEMQDGILEVRMVPLGQVFDRLARVVRQISREMRKEIRLVITGAETEIDKLIVEELSDPLMHIIRNSIDHGIEAADDRRHVGKPDAGTIALNAFQKGNHVMLEIEDDGKGIDTDRLVARAVAMGVLDDEEARDLSRHEVLALVFLPGLSTRAEASDVSGRGVGMDVVKTNIAKLGGVIDIQSEPGIGTKMTITLPITLAIVSALIVTLRRRTFALPLSSVSEAISFDGRGVRKVDGREVMTLRGTTLPLCRLGDLLQLSDDDDPHRRQYVVVTSLGSRRLGLIVDELHGQQDIVIKALGRSLSKVRGFAGATELGDSRVGLVLDAGAIIEEVLATVDTAVDTGRIRGGQWQTS